MSEKAVPFGLLFEEVAVDPGEAPVPVYDEQRDISFVERDGTLTPLASVIAAGMATHTLTAVQSESTDRDVQPPEAHWYLSTMTETKAEGEDTDRDRASDLMVMISGQEASTAKGAETCND